MNEVSSRWNDFQVMTWKKNQKNQPTCFQRMCPACSCLIFGCDDFWSGASEGMRTCCCEAVVFVCCCYVCCWTCLVIIVRWLLNKMKKVDSQQIFLFGDKGVSFEVQKISLIFNFSIFRSSRPPLLYCSVVIACQLSVSVGQLLRPLFFGVVEIYVLPC